jgi:hypothetical protein
MNHLSGEIPTSCLKQLLVQLRFVVHGGIHVPCARGTGTGVGAFSERISKWQMSRQINARGVTDGPTAAGASVLVTAGSNRILPGSGKVTEERVQPAGESATTAERERNGESRSNISARC